MVSFKGNRRNFEELQTCLKLCNKIDILHKHNILITLKMHYLKDILNKVMNRIRYIKRIVGIV